MPTNPLDKKSQAWSALFSEPMSELVKRYTASVNFDQRLWKADITGSLAHAEMLGAQGIIGADDLVSIRQGLAAVREEIEAGQCGRTERQPVGAAPYQIGRAHV